METICKKCNKAGTFRYQRGNRLKDFNCNGCGGAVELIYLEMRDANTATTKDKRRFQLKEGFWHLIK